MICYITVWNLLSPLPQLIDDIRRFGGTPVIIDNASTYPPLLEWLGRQDRVPIIRMAANYGPRAAWTLGLDQHERFVITDGDLDLSQIPDDALAVIAEGFSEDPAAHKVGFSLRIDDLPADGPLTAAVREWESRYWTQPLGNRYYRADIDTTFAMYDMRRPGNAYGPALRTAPPYAARHIPWYWTKDAVTGEIRYYLKALANAVGARTWSPRLVTLLDEEKI
jgi:hypothetical protein